MSNCLVTKLKGNVTGDLPYLDSIRLYIAWDSITELELKGYGAYTTKTQFGGVGTTVKVLDNGAISTTTNNSTWTDVGTEYTMGANNHGVRITPIDSSSETLILIEGMGTISYFWLSTTNPVSAVSTDDYGCLAYTGVNYKYLLFPRGHSEDQDLSLLSSVPNKASVTNIYFPVSGIKGDISYLSKFTNLKTVIAPLTQNNTNVGGDISALAGLTSLTSITMKQNDNIKGLVSSLSGLTALTTLDLQSTQVSGNLDGLGGCVALTTLTLSSTSVTGTVEALASAMLTAGRESGTLTINASHTAITNNDSTFISATITFSSGSYSIA